MSGAFNAGGLITGLDTNSIIRQLMALERQPIIRVQDRISVLEEQKTALSDLRTTLLTLRNLVQNFRFGLVFDQFTAPSSDENVLTAEVSGPNPTVGAFAIDVTQLASATVATSSGVLGAAIDPNLALDSSGISTSVTAGTFTINGRAIIVDPTTQSLNTILDAINASGAGVTATFDALTDTVTIANTTPGDTSIINLGATDDDSNFLEAINAEGATQFTNGSGSTELQSTRNLGSVDPSANLNVASFGGGAVTAGNFFVNGVAITVDITTDSIADVIGAINASDAGVTASFDTATDTIRVISDTLGSRTINFTSGTSNFLDVTNLAAASQTAGNDSEFTINAGPVQTRNTNEVSDAIGGLTINLRSIGTSTVTVTADDDSIVEDIQEFIDAFNEGVSELAAATGADGDLRSDGTIRTIETFLRSNIFSLVSGISGDFSTLLQIGISTGSAFDSSSISQLTLDANALRDAIREDRNNVSELFSNVGNTGIADILFNFLDANTSITGPLNIRSKAGGSIDRQIRSMNDRIDSLERRLAQRELRLRAQFTRLEILTSGFQVQSLALSGLRSGFRSFF